MPLMLVQIHNRNIQYATWSIFREISEWALYSWRSHKTGVNTMRNDPAFAPQFPDALRNHVTRVFREKYHATSLSKCAGLDPSQ